MDSTHLVWLGLGLLSGAAVAWGALSGRARAARRGALLEGLARAAALEARLAEREAGLNQLREALVRRDQELRGALGEARAQGELRAGLEASLAEERRSAAAQAALLDLAQERLSDAFKALSAEALAAQGRQFLELAQGSLERFQDGARTDLSQRQQAIAELVAPVRETVVRLGDSLQRLEVARTDAYRALHEQVRFLSEGQGLLRAEAGKLVQALRAPAVRGRWGEIQLRRVVELAGMQAHCDFVEQAGIAGGRLRPDLVVRLPGGKVVAVDAKVPLSAYLEAVEATEEPVRRARLADHARQVAAHVAQLAAKAYHEHLGHTPEFVVLFIPGESSFAAALEQDPELLEKAAAAGVVLATPTTLIALLKAVASGWQQEVVAESARAVQLLGRELHDRLATLGGHVERLGRSLGRSVESYNELVGSLEARVLPAARRLKELGAGTPSALVPALSDVDELPRAVHAPDLGGLP